MVEEGNEGALVFRGTRIGTGVPQPPSELSRMEHPRAATSRNNTNNNNNSGGAPLLEMIASHLQRRWSLKCGNMTCLEEACTKLIVPMMVPISAVISLVPVPRYLDVMNAGITTAQFGFINCHY